jgi:Domain of unknown function (DUF5658)
MFSIAPGIVLALALSTGVEPASTRIVPPAPVEASIALSDSRPGPKLRLASPGIGEPAPKLPKWMVDRTGRPRALPAMYATLGALQALDVYSTRRALGRGASEVNPIVQGPSGNAGAMLAVKALSTAGSIYFTERAWKKNRKGAVILMAIVNGVTAAVVANNLTQAR